MNSMKSSMLELTDEQLNTVVGGTGCHTHEHYQQQHEHNKRKKQEQCHHQQQQGHQGCFRVHSQSC